MIKIGLMGFDCNCPNKGCEALSYSFVKMLSEITSDKLEIHIYAYANLGLFPQVYPDIEFVWHRLKMKNPFYWIKMLRDFNKYDVIFDITYGDGFSDIYGKMWNANTDMAKQLAIISKTPLILLPQTYGPYESSLLKKWAVHIVKKSKLSFSRDDLSAIEMKENGCGSIIPSTDLAFALSFDKDKYKFQSTKNKIGLNVSSLLWDQGHNIILKTDYKKYCREIIKKYTDLSDYEIHLIPHVIDKDNRDTLENDSRVCGILHSEFPETVLAPDFDNPIDAKSYISNMDVLIGARMHATIGAISSGTPAIPVSYSKKFEGLFNKLEYPFVISATKISTEKAIDTTLKYIDNIKELEEKRVKAMLDIEDILNMIKTKIREFVK